MVACGRACLAVLLRARGRARDASFREASASPPDHQKTASSAPTGASCRPPKRYNNNNNNHNNNNMKTVRHGECYGTLRRSAR
eukprot:3823841-Alexandrium_andersonii.AAC.1